MIFALKNRAFNPGKSNRSKGGCSVFLHVAGRVKTTRFLYIHTLKENAASPLFHVFV